GGRFKRACANAVCSTKLPANGINRIAVWDGSAYTSLGNGFDSDVFSLAVASNGVYATGVFTRLCADAGCSATLPANGVNHIAFPNGATWLPVGKGLDDFVWAVVLAGSTPYFGGSFTHACADDACAAMLPASGLNYAASFSGGSFQPLGFGL